MNSGSVPVVHVFWMSACWLVVIAIAIADSYERRIPNWLVLCLACLYPICWWTKGAVFRDLEIAITSAVVVGALLFIFWLINVCGAGDVKLFAVLSLYCAGYLAVAGLILAFGLAGMYAGLIAQTSWTKPTKGQRLEDSRLDIPLGAIGCFAFMLVYWMSVWYR